MAAPSVIPVDEEITFDREDIIVSKTDPSGIITYANDIFCKIAEMTTKDVIGQPHNIIRHPDMPRIIFKVLWDQLKSGSEIFAYVKNMSKTGKFYWVIAHVTPSFDKNRELTGYNSTRRCPTPRDIKSISALYQTLLIEEMKHESPTDQLKASGKALEQVLDQRNDTYEEFIWSMIN